MYSFFQLLLILLLLFSNTNCLASPYVKLSEEVCNAWLPELQRDHLIDYSEENPIKCPKGTFHDKSSGSPTTKCFIDKELTKLAYDFYHLDRLRLFQDHVIFAPSDFLNLHLGEDSPGKPKVTSCSRYRYMLPDPKFPKAPFMIEPEWRVDPDDQRKKLGPVKPSYTFWESDSAFSQFITTEGKSWYEQNVDPVLLTAVKTAHPNYRYFVPYKIFGQKKSMGEITTISVIHDSKTTLYAYFYNNKTNPLVQIDTLPYDEKQIAIWGPSRLVNDFSSLCLDYKVKKCPTKPPTPLDKTAPIFKFEKLRLQYDAKNPADTNAIYPLYTSRVYYRDDKDKKYKLWRGFDAFEDKTDNVPPEGLI